MKFLASDRARLHRGADIIEVREKSKNINFHFSTEQDYIREADIIDNRLNVVKLALKRDLTLDFTLN